MLRDWASFIFFIDFEERKKEIYSIYLCIHWLILIYALNEDQIQNPGIWDNAL